MAEQKRYWSVTECGWVPSPGAPDMLATPWGLAAGKVPAAAAPPAETAAASVPELPGQRHPVPQQADAER